MLSLPWIITFGPLDDSDEWEPVVCGPYERAHALALAETVVADEELMAVVEAVQPHASVDDIRLEIAGAKQAAEEAEEDELEGDEDFEDVEVAMDEEFDAEHEHDHDPGDHDHDDEYEDLEEIEPSR